VAIVRSIPLVAALDYFHATRGCTLAYIEAETDEPILFRTTGEAVCKSTLHAGSLWLRSDKYYRDLEDQIRNDAAEGVSSGTTALPVQFQQKNGVQIRVEGKGNVGRLLGPHYIVSLHGTSISESQRAAFGGHTFGVRSLFRLSAEVLCEASRQIKCTAYRHGPVRYHYAALAHSNRSVGGPAIQFDHDPPRYLNPLDADALRKRPIQPFIEQDEWRIVVFTDGYLDGDPTLPLKVNVSPSHFYPYLDPTGT
jgi:hypothetical protein